MNGSPSGDGKNDVVLTKPRQFIYPAAMESPGTRSNCDMGLDCSTYFDTTEDECLPARSRNPRFALRVLTEARGRPGRAPSREAKPYNRIR